MQHEMPHFEMKTDLLFDATATSNLAQMRSATKDVHERLHEHPILSFLTTSHLTLPHYMRVLYSFERFYENLHRAFRSRQLDIIGHKLNLIRQDLRSLALAPNPLPACEYISATASKSRIMGIEYVILGSALGATMIAKNIEKQLGLTQQHGNAFFGSGQQTIQENWQHFLRVLESDCADINDCCDSARHCFEGLEQWLWDVSRQPDMEFDDAKP